MKTNTTYINIEILRILIVRVNAKTSIEMPVNVLGEYFIRQSHELGVVPVNHDLTHTMYNRHRIKCYK